VAWGEFLEKLAELRQKPDFDQEERVYKLEIAPLLVGVLNVARDGGDYLNGLDAAFRKRGEWAHYNLTNWRQNDWFLSWARKDEDRVRTVLSSFLDSNQDPESRFEAFAAAAEEAERSGLAPRNRAATLAFGSLFNFAVEPQSLPLVRTQVFETAERAVGRRLEHHESAAEDYRQHLAFARETEDRLRQAGVPVRDMVDVQSLLFLASFPADAGDEDAAAGPEADEVRVWCCRAGAEGQEELALDQNVAVIGWSSLGPLSPELSLEEIKKKIEEVKHEHRTQSQAMQAGEIYRFIHEISEGDLVVLPRKNPASRVAVGRVAGKYEHRDDGPFATVNAQNTRPVDWLAKDLPYERFDSDLRAAFGQRASLSEITKPNAAQRILDVVGGADASAVHLVVKWAERFGANTVDEHRKVAAERGEVWWGLIGSLDRPKLSQRWMDAIRSQLGGGLETRVFISGPTCWSTTLRDIAGPNETIDRGLVPGYYPSEYEHSLWVKLVDFERIDRSWLTEHLELVSTPGAPLSEGALRNQTNPLIVRQVGGNRAHTQRVWWVCQGQTYRSARDLGVLWAPKIARDGSGRAYWRALQEARVGDLVIHYADNQVRAVSTVSGEALDSPRPEELKGEWVEGDGWLVHTDYRELEAPISLSEIPAEWRIAEQGPFTRQGSVQQGYFFPLSDQFVNQVGERFPQLGLPGGGGGETYTEPTFEQIEAAIAEMGLRISDRNLRRYHVSLKTRGFVVLAGVSGSGKTWLAEAYADVIGAEQLRVPVAPNWTTNEDLLGYLNPIDGKYRHTDFSRFLQRAAMEYSDAQAANRSTRPFHLILDEMNLARVEYYFAKFLSAMEARARYGTAPIALAEDLEVQLTPNLKFIGTVNVDETTFGFSDKVYDRAQLIELDAPWDALAAHMQGKPFEAVLHAVWNAVHVVAPFAFRIVDEFDAYVAQSERLGVDWQEAVDDQLLQKVLPKIKGTDPRIRDALEGFVAATQEAFPLSHEKASEMLEAFNTHGFVSYF
jgi:AAA domain (dynein-related subfamily)